MQIVTIEIKLNQDIKRKKRKALNLIFEEMQSLDNGKSNKENVIDIIDNAISSLIEIPKRDCDFADIREDLKNLIWIRDLIKMC